MPSYDTTEGPGLSMNRRIFSGKEERKGRRHDPQEDRHPLGERVDRKSVV